MLGLLVAYAACTTQSPKPAPTFEAGVELPEGQGRDVLVASCLSCHQLGGLALFKGYYTRELWRSLVVTMTAYGAEIDRAEIEVLADYLEQHFGPDTR